MKIKMTSVIAIAAIALPLFGAGASELRVGFTLDALTLDPANHRKRETETIIRNMFDGLLTRDAKMNVVPEIAESYTAIDNTTYEFKIRKGIVFHDGTPLTAADIKYTFDRLTVENAMGGQTSPRKSLLGPIKEIQQLDDYTVRFVLTEPWPLLPAMLPFQEVVSKAFVEKVGTEGAATQANGTGPFKLAEWNKGDSIVMERFDGYYGGASDIPPVGKACVDRVIFKIIPENASRTAALLAGDVDIINELPAHDIKQVENNPNTQVMMVRGTRSFFIALNTTKAPFDNMLVRQAIAYAVDKNLIIDKILGGNATPISAIMSPDAFAYRDDLNPYAYDPTKAKALLAEAGYPDGIDISLDTEGAFKDISEALSAVMSKAGIRVKVEVGEGSQLKDKWSKKDAPRVGDMWFTSWGNGSLDPVDIFDPTHVTNGRGNSSGYSNANLDALLKAGSTEADPQKRIAAYADALTLINHEVPYVYLWVPMDVYGVSKRVTGWQPSADSRINLHDACVK